MSWTNDEVLEFVELYRREQLLWDPKHPLHRNRSEVTDAWLRIQNSMCRSCSITDLKKKKESLMTSFRMHWNKKKKSQDAYYTTWFVYPLMESFLGGKYECDSTIQIENEFYNTSSASYTNTAQSLQSPTIVSASREKSDVTGRSKATVCQLNPLERDTSNSIGYDHTKKQIDDVHTNILKRPFEEKRDTDEYDLYCQLLATKLRKLDEHQRDVAMHEIDNIMFQAKMQNGASQIRNFPSPVPPKIKSPIFIVAPSSHNNTQFEEENIGYQEHNIQTEPPP